jgi:hypothetical protein
MCVLSKKTYIGPYIFGAEIEEIHILVRTVWSRKHRITHIEARFLTFWSRKRRNTHIGSYILEPKTKKYTDCFYAVIFMERLLNYFFEVVTMPVSRHLFANILVVYRKVNILFYHVLKIIFPDFILQKIIKHGIFITKLG